MTEVTVEIMTSTALTKTTELSNQLNLSLKYSFIPYPVNFVISSNIKNPKKNLFKFSSNFSNSLLSLSLVKPSTIVLAMMITNETDRNIFEAAIL